MYQCNYLWVKMLQSNNKAVMKATLLREVNSKIKATEGNSSIKLQLTCWYPLMGKKVYENIQPAVCRITSYFAIVVNELSKPKVSYKSHTGVCHYNPMTYGDLTTGSSYASCIVFSS